MVNIVNQHISHGIPTVYMSLDLGDEVTLVMCIWNIIVLGLYMQGGWCVYNECVWLVYKQD